MTAKVSESRQTALGRIAYAAGAFPRHFLVAALLITAAAGLFGVPVAKTLCACGFEDPAAESARAAQLLTDHFGQGDAQLVIAVTDTHTQDYRSAAARRAGEQIADLLKSWPSVATVTSAWTAPGDAAATLVSRDGRTGLIVAGITGAPNAIQHRTEELTRALPPDRDEVTVRAGGAAMVDLQITEQSQRDLLLMESLAIPLSFAVLVWVFGGLLAAALPIAVGGMAILGAMAVLRGVTLFTDVSIFALNLSAALGLALAIDYTLLMISRYRDELADGADRPDAVVTMMTTSGRTVLFSASIVALSMSVMVLFPMHFLKSFAYAGVATVAFAALAALLITPAAITLLGDRLDRRGSHARQRPVQDQPLYRWTMLVMRRALPFGVAVIALLVVLGAPFAGVKWGFPDDRVLPSSASAHQVGDQLREDFPDTSETSVTVVLPDVSGLSDADLAAYRAALGRVPDVSAVTPPTIVGDSAMLTVHSTAPLFTERSDAQLDSLHDLAAPGGHEVLLTGTAQTNRDSVAAITSRLPPVLGAIAVIMFVLLFLLTGSVVIPIKALVLNLLSLSAAFGAMVWIFQDGHLGALGTTATGTLVANIPVLLFCIAFGLSMDYEVFLVARIREYWLASPQRREDNDTSVALGIARTGRVVTAAAVVMSISFAALIAADVSFMRMFGLGLTLAVLADATLVRMALMPAFMHLLAERNWWAPKWMSRLHDRFGLHEGDDVTSGRVPMEGKVS